MVNLRNLQLVRYLNLDQCHKLDLYQVGTRTKDCQQDYQRRQYRRRRLLPRLYKQHCNRCNKSQFPRQSQHSTDLDMHVLRPQALHALLLHRRHPLSPRRLKIHSSKPCTILLDKRAVN